MAGYLADLVDNLSWEVTLAKYPDANAFVGRLRGALERKVAGRRPARPAVPIESASTDSGRKRGTGVGLPGGGTQFVATDSTRRPPG